MLDAVGLSADDQALYEAILNRGPTNLDEARELCTSLTIVPVPDVPGALHRLAALGLLTVDADERHYAATPSVQALERLLIAAEQALLTARRQVLDLEQEHRNGRIPPAHTESAPAIELVHGAKQVRRRFFGIQDDAPGQIRGTEGPPYLTVEDDPHDTVNELLADGLGYRIIYDPRALDLPTRPYGDVLDVSDGRRVRIGTIPTKLVLTDQPIALLPLTADLINHPSCMVVRHPVLLETLSQLFELNWRRAVPLNVSGDCGEHARALLPLLVAGLTDLEIAAKLCWSHRTVRRRVRDLMVALDAPTRFSAGYQAVQRGWIDGNDDADRQDDNEDLDRGDDDGSGDDG